MVPDIVAIDPGETTGVCWFQLNRFWWREFGPTEHHGVLWKFLYTLDIDNVVCERFDKRSDNPGAELISLEYVGVVKSFCRVYEGKTLYYNQTASDAKTVWNDSKLERLHIELPPKHPAHMRDAMRHLLLCLQKSLGCLDFVYAIRPRSNGEDSQDV